MFVVRVRNDEATLYRAFRRLQSARQWAADADDAALSASIDMFVVDGADDSRSAINAARLGQARHVVRAEAVKELSFPAGEAIGDIRFSHPVATGR